MIDRRAGFLRKSHLHGQISHIAVPNLLNGGWRRREHTDIVGLCPIGEANSYEMSSYRHACDPQPLMVTGVTVLNSRSRDSWPGMTAECGQDLSEDRRRGLAASRLG